MTDTNQEQNTDPYKHKERLNRVLKEIETGRAPQPSKRKRPKTFPGCPMPERNKQAILNFAAQAQAEACTPSRTLRLIEYCRDLNALLEGKDFKEASKEDMVKVIGKIEAAPIKPWTRCGFKAAIKKFYKWYEGEGDAYPNKIKWVKTTMKKHERKLPESMISREELQRIIEYCESPRDRALVAVLGESGPRLSELLSLHIKHFNPCDDALGGCASITYPSGKTGARKNPLMFSASFITAWLDSHPHRDNPEAELWYTDREDRDSIGPGRVRAILARATKKAGVKKPCNPHAFRHAACSFYAQFMSTFQLNLFFGWTGSAANTYAHLSSKDLIGTCQQANAMPVKQEATAANGDLLPVPCPKCKENNPPKNSYCWKCASPMSIKQVVDVQAQEVKREDLLSEILAHPALSQIIADIKSKKQGLPAK